MPRWPCPSPSAWLTRAAPWLSASFVNEDFAFRSRFSGAKQLLPRWKRCLLATDGSMGEILGQPAHFQKLPTGGVDYDTPTDLLGTMHTGGVLVPALIMLSIMVASKRATWILEFHSFSARA